MREQQNRHFIKLNKKTAPEKLCAAWLLRLLMQRYNEGEYRKRQKESDERHG